MYPQTNQHSSSAFHTATHSNSINSLIIDDDPVVKHTLIPDLQQAFKDMSFTHVSTTFEAIQQAYLTRPMLVIVEAKLNQTSGINLIPIFKNNIPGVICIVLTKFRDAELAASAIHSGADEFILKPFDIHYLTEVIADKLLKQASIPASRQSDTMLRTMFQNCANLLILMDKAGHIIEANNTLLAATGYSKDELIGHHLMSSNMWSSSASSKKRIRNRLAKATQGKFVRDEIEILCADSRTTTVDFSLKPVVDQSGAVDIIVLEAREINSYKRQERRLYQLAHYDHLTQLPNRILFNDRLAQTIRGAKRFNRVMAVLFVDIDDFKYINDKYGHDAGDNILLMIASKIRRCLREVDTVSRLGGDEFAVILTEIKDIETTVETAQRIIDAVAKPMLYEGAEMKVTASVGIALYPEDATNVSELLSHADMAMYQAKQQGKNHYMFYREMPH